MNNQNGTALLMRAYRLLERETPLKSDCGRLCGGRCCKGDDAGMWLFPYERALFEDKPGFTIHEGREDIDIVICEGSCERSMRPLSCRIFPLFPVTAEYNGELLIKLIADPRGREMCPLARMGVTPRFKRKLRLMTKLLLRDENMKAFLLKTSEILIKLDV